MALAVGLWQHVVGLVDREVLARERVVLLLPHARDLADGLVPLGARRARIVDVERGDLVRARTPSGAELEAPVAQVVEHRGPLGVADRVVHARAQVEDARTEVDPLGGAGQVAHVDVAGRDVAVLGEGMVLGHPHVLPAGAVGDLDEIRLVEQRRVLGRGVMGRRARHETLDEDAELHDVSCQRERGRPRPRSAMIERWISLVPA